MMPEIRGIIFCVIMMIFIVIQALIQETRINNHKPIRHWLITLVRAAVAFPIIAMMDHTMDWWPEYAFIAFSTHVMFFDYTLNALRGKPIEYVSTARNSAVWDKLVVKIPPIVRLALRLFIFIFSIGLLFNHDVWQHL